MAVLSPGTKLKSGTFEIVSEIGRGGFGVVYLARQSRVQRLVAIKVLLAGISSNEEMVVRFQREALAAANLLHPNVLTVLDFDFDDQAKVWFLASPYVPGGRTLRSLLGGPLPLTETAHLIEGIAGALDAAHANGIVHRDVKPENVLLDGTRPLLTDFGLAHLQAARGVTVAGMSLGTPAYMSPEQALGNPVGPRSDQYALAVMAFEMLAGRPPFVGNAISLMFQHANTAPPPLGTFNAGIGAGARSAVALALSKNPDDRFSSCEEFAQALQLADRASNATPERLVPRADLSPNQGAAASITPSYVLLPSERAPHQTPVPPLVPVPRELAPPTERRPAPVITPSISSQPLGKPFESDEVLPVTVTLTKPSESAPRRATPSPAEVRSSFTRRTGTESIGAVRESARALLADPQPGGTTNEPSPPSAPRRRRAPILAVLAVAVLAVAAFVALPRVIVPASRPGGQPTDSGRVTTGPQPAALVPPAALDLGATAEAATPPALVSEARVAPPPVLPGAVRVTSRPDGGIMVNGEPAGSTPRLLNLEPGDYELVLLAPSYQDFTQRIHVEEGGAIAVDADLVPLRSLDVLEITEARLGRDPRLEANNLIRLGTLAETFTVAHDVNAIVYLKPKTYTIRDLSFTFQSRWQRAGAPPIEQQGDQFVRKEWEQIFLRVCAPAIALDARGSNAPLNLEISIEGEVVARFTFRIGPGNPASAPQISCGTSAAAPDFGFTAESDRGLARSAQLGSVVYESSRPDGRSHGSERATAWLG